MQRTLLTFVDIAIQLVAQESAILHTAKACLNFLTTAEQCAIFLASQEYSEPKGSSRLPWERLKPLCGSSTPIRAIDAAPTSVIFFRAKNDSPSDHRSFCATLEQPTRGQ